MIFPKELKEFFKNWEKDFKSDLGESIKKDIEDGLSLKESILMIIKELFPIWIEEAEDTELINVYNIHQKKLVEIYKKL